MQHCRNNSKKRLKLMGMKIFKTVVLLIVAQTNSVFFARCLRLAFVFWKFASNPFIDPNWAVAIVVESDIFRFKSFRRHCLS